MTVIYSMGCGGAERVMASLANQWSMRGHEVVVATLNGDPSFYPLLASVGYRPLGLGSPPRKFSQRLRNSFHCVRVLRRLVRDLHPNVIITFLDKVNVITLLATLGQRVPVIACEHNDPEEGNCGLVWGILRTLAYLRAAAVTLLTQSALDNMRWLVGHRGVVMPNPVIVPSVYGSNHSPGPCPSSCARRLLAMGRLHPVKGFDLLIEAFYRIAKKHPGWNLTILGEGCVRPKLEQQINERALTGRVDLPGNVHDPFRWLRTADLFVMSSRYEAFPCALCEALACGLPAISFDCPSGPRAIIRHDFDGVLVPPGDVDALAGTMDRLMGDAVERQRLASHAPDVLQRFSMEKILGLWDGLFARVGVCEELPALGQPIESAFPN